MRVVCWAALAVPAQQIRTSAALSQLVQLLRKLEVLLRYPVLGMRDQRAARQPPRKEQVRMVVAPVRDRRHPVHELDPTAEVFELELAVDAVSVLLPAVVQIRQPCLHI